MATPFHLSGSDPFMVLLATRRRITFDIHVSRMVREWHFNIATVSGARAVHRARRPRTSIWLTSPTACRIVFGDAVSCQHLRPIALGCTGKARDLGALGTTATGTLSTFLPVPLFCFAFALSMDYEVFLVARIREYWLKSERTHADNEDSVALGVTRTGRVVTAAALLMAIPFAAQSGGQVALIRMFGIGLTIALLVDATLIRMVLLPAFMQLLGRWNWWAPAPLARLHQRLSPERTPAPP